MKFNQIIDSTLLLATKLPSYDLKKCEANIEEMEKMRDESNIGRYILIGGGAILVGGIAVGTGFALVLGIQALIVAGSAITTEMIVAAGIAILKGFLNIVTKKGYWF